MSDELTGLPASCNCIGPQNNQPLCPCQMRGLGVFQRDGRWVQPERDLGPVLPTCTTNTAQGWRLPPGWRSRQQTGHNNE